MGNLLSELQRNNSEFLVDIMDNYTLRRSLQSQKESIREDYNDYLKCPWKYQVDRIGHVIDNNMSFEKFKKQNIQFRYGGDDKAISSEV